MSNLQSVTVVNYNLWLAVATCCRWFTSTNFLIFRFFTSCTTCSERLAVTYSRVSNCASQFKSHLRITLNKPHWQKRLLPARNGVCRLKKLRSEVNYRWVNSESQPRASTKSLAAKRRWLIWDERLGHRLHMMRSFNGDQCCRMVLANGR